MEWGNNRGKLRYSIVRVTVGQVEEAIGQGIVSAEADNLELKG